MKSLYFLVINLLILIYPAKSQNLNKAFTCSEIIWYGLDFTHAKMLGTHGFPDAYEVRNKYFKDWNAVVIDEKEKYDLRKSFRKSSVIYSVTLVSKRNKNVSTQDLITNNISYSIPENKIQDIITAYQTERNNGVGVVFIIESFNKFNRTATMHVVMFDIADRVVLVQDKITGKASGFGLRNYWVNSVYRVLNKIDKTYYNKWLN